MGREEDQRKEADVVFCFSIATYRSLSLSPNQMAGLEMRDSERVEDGRSRGPVQSGSSKNRRLGFDSIEGMVKEEDRHAGRQSSQARRLIDRRLEELERRERLIESRTVRYSWSFGWFLKQISLDNQSINQSTRKSARLLGSK